MNSCAIDRARETILKRWEMKSRATLPATWDKARSELRDHLPDLLKVLTDYLDGQFQGDVKRMSEIHGRQRFSFGDYTLAQVLGEYQMLKEIVFEYADDPDPAVTRQRLIKIDAFFDEASNTAASIFATLRENELKETTGRLQKSHEELERFVGVVAHDLRSPLATMIGFCDLLKEETEPTQVQDYVDVIAATARRSVDLIDSLLEYTKIGNVELKRERVDLGQVLRSAEQNLHEAMEKTRTKVTSTNLGAVIGDPVLIGQVFQNLLANSLKFRKAEGPSQIHISQTPATGDFVRICFEDNGVGFNPDQKNEIFKPFKSAHSETTYQGSGLGLATCQKVVEAHGGVIEAFGELGAGAKFCFTLPAHY